jgi:hypothetical protein
MLSARGQKTVLVDTAATWNPWSDAVTEMDRWVKSGTSWFPGCSSYGLHRSAHQKLSAYPEPCMPAQLVSRACGSPDQPQQHLPAHMEVTSMHNPPVAKVPVAP